MPTSAVRVGTILSADRRPMTTLVIEGANLDAPVEVQSPPTLRPIPSPAAYVVRLAARGLEVRACQSLRYHVFNLELGEGLTRSHTTGLDADAFDPVCDHLLVEHRPTGQVVGTYRLQTGLSAAQQRGYYSEQEFDFRPFERLRSELVELGRACVHRDHRNLNVLGLLWKGVAAYMRAHGGRYLCGCSSITSQDAAVGASAYTELCRGHLASPELRTTPLAAFECPLDCLTPEPVMLPRLLRAYLTLGARICGPPALDREFGTIDFLTFLDLETLPGPARRSLFGG